MFQQPDMAENFLSNLCGSSEKDGAAEIIPSGTELPFSVEELNFVLARKKDSAPGMDGIKYGDVIEFPTAVKIKFLEVINDVWASQNIPAVLKRILMVVIPKPRRDPQLIKSHCPTALLSVYLKIINSMIKNRLEGLINDKALILWLCKTSFLD